ncbi:MAG: response regulator [bacterium]
MTTLLIVEDDGHQRLLLKEELEEEGYDVRTTADPGDALRKVSARLADLVVLEPGAPEAGGIELLGRLLRIDQCLPVVIYTAYEEYQEDSVAWAADACVLKHSDLRELKDAIRTVLDGRGGAPERAATAVQLSGA